MGNPMQMRTKAQEGPSLLSFRVKVVYPHCHVLTYPPPCPSPASFKAPLANFMNNPHVATSEPFILLEPP